MGHIVELDGRKKECGYKVFHFENLKFTISLTGSKKCFKICYNFTVVDRDTGLMNEFSGSNVGVCSITGKMFNKCVLEYIFNLLFIIF